MKKSSTFSLDENFSTDFDALADRYGYNRSALLRIILNWNLEKIKKEGVGYLFEQKITEKRYLERS